VHGAAPSLGDTGAAEDRRPPVRLPDVAGRTWRDAFGGAWAGVSGPGARRASNRKAFIMVTRPHVPGRVLRRSARRQPPPRAGTEQRADAELVPVCDRCWVERGGQREVRHRPEPLLERCMWCGAPTYSGAYTTL
jgi:hypothetical protein